MEIVGFLKDKRKERFLNEKRFSKETKLSKIEKKQKIGVESG